MTQKGIWIQKDESSIYYLTWLKEIKENLVGFIPFENNYKPTYLGSIGFIDLSNSRFDFSRYNLKKGLLQNHFYPLGGNPKLDKPLLLGKGLARNIEFKIAQDLQTRFPLDTLIAIGASSDSHLGYCKKIRIIPWKQMSIGNYVEILSKQTFTNN